MQNPIKKTSKWSFQALMSCLFIIPSKQCKPQWLLIYFGLFIWFLRGKRSFCRFNSFVNVFMNAISTSFTLLCFWIPLRYGLCQVSSPRRGEASCSTPLSCVAEHWQTQFTGGEHEMTLCRRSCCDMYKWSLSLIPNKTSPILGKCVFTQGSERETRLNYLTRK